MDCVTSTPLIIDLQSKWGLVGYADINFSSRYLYQYSRALYDVICALGASILYEFLKYFYIPLSGDLSAASMSPLSNCELLGSMASPALKAAKASGCCLRQLWAMPWR